MGDSMEQVTLPDYSEFLAVEANLKNEEDQWAARGFYKRNAEVLQAFINETKAQSVLEIGCGTGWIPANIKVAEYTGVDKNLACIFIAKDRPGNDYATFVISDLREMADRCADIVVCFAVLKHFGLHEWDSVFRSVLRRGKYALFTMQIADEDKDDGEQYHHSWITEEHLRQAVKDAGHEIIKTEVWGVCEAGKGVEWMVWTRNTATANTTNT